MCVRACMHVGTCVRACVCVSVRMCMCVCAHLCTLAVQHAAGLLRAAPLISARAAGHRWLQLAWPASLTVTSGGKSHVAAAKKRLPSRSQARRGGPSPDRQLLCAAAAPEPEGYSCAWAGLGAADTRRGWIPIWAPRAGVAGLPAGARAPRCCGRSGVSTGYFLSPRLSTSRCLLSSALSGFRFQGSERVLTWDGGTG